MLQKRYKYTPDAEVWIDGELAPAGSKVEVICRLPGGVKGSFVRPAGVYLDGQQVSADVYVHGQQIWPDAC